MAQATTLSVQAANTVINANGNSGNINVSNFNELAIDINITAKNGSPSIQFFIDRIGADGVAYNIWSSSSISSSTAVVSDSIGAGLNVAKSLGTNVQFRWVFTGSTSYTYSASLIGK